MSRPTALLLSLAYPFGARVLSAPNDGAPVVAVRGDVLANPGPLGWHCCIATTAYVPAAGIPDRSSTDAFHWCADPGPSWSGGGAGAPSPYFLTVIDVITGSFPDAPLGTITFVLSSSAVVLGTSPGQNAPAVTTYPLDSNGNLPNGAVLWGNDQLQPTGTYTVSLHSSTGALVRGPGSWAIVGTSPIYLNGIIFH
jgi:hypothetical protein